MTDTEPLTGQAKLDHEERLQDLALLYLAEEALENPEAKEVLKRMVTNHELDLEELKSLQHKYRFVLEAYRKQKNEGRI
jgi:hypothetical protein